MSPSLSSIVVHRVRSKSMINSYGASGCSWRTSALISISLVSPPGVSITEVFSYITCMALIIFSGMIYA